MAHTVMVTGNRVDYDALAARGFTVAATPDGAAGMVVLFLPRNRAQALGQIAQALDLLPPGGWLVIDGQKTDGVDATLRHLSRLIPLADTRARDHGKTAWLQRPATLPEALIHWREEAAPRPLPDGSQTAPGMFSADGPDPGTVFLADALPRTLSGAAADFGAGWGALSAALLVHAPGITSLDMIEADYASAEAARANVTDPRATARWADATTWTGGPYDVIVSNPPFHVSRSADPSLGTAFIAAAARCLAPKGQLWLVANRQLPYEGTLDAQFGQWEEAARNARYKVIHATRPKAGAKARRA